MQRFRSNSSSSTLDNPLSPTYLSHIGPSQSSTTTTNYEKSSTANINIIHNTNNHTSRRGGPINISAPPLTSPPSSLPRSAYDTPPTPTSPRLPQSPISSAAGVMKKLLRRRRGQTADETGLGIVDVSSSTHNGSTGYDAVSVSSPEGPGIVHSFVIVGGQGAVAAGTTVYDLEPPSPVSPSMTVPMTNMVSPPLSSSSASPSFSPTTRASSGSMGPLVGTTGMISPRSPTFPQSMMTRFSAGRDHHQQQQHMHMHMQQQHTFPAAHVIPPSSSTSPVPIPVRGRSRQPSITNTAPVTPSTASAASPPASVIRHPGQVQSLSLSAAHLHRRLDRRSLSADSLWSDKDQPSSSVQPASIAPDMPVQTPSSLDQQQPPISSKTSPSPLSSDRHGHIQGDVEFFKKSVEFLRTHHSRHNTADDWANRNKRKHQLPVRRQSESCLLDRIADNHVGVSDSASTSHKKKAILSSSVSTNGENEDCEVDEPRAFGPGSCWKDLDPTYPSIMDFDQLVDDNDRSLLSSVDILLMPTISSPTRYYDCPRSRKLVRTYLTSKGCEFDEMIEFGFPLTSVVDDNRSSSSSSSRDCRFLTLRLTLTPWHARADEAKLYGPDDAVVAVTIPGVPIKEKVNKFLSRTSAKLSGSPPRILSLLPDSRSILSIAPDRKLSLTPDSSLAIAAQQQQPSSLDSGAVSPLSVVSHLPTQIPRSLFDMSAGTGTTTTTPQYGSSQLPPLGLRSIKTGNSGTISPAPFNGGVLPPRRDKGFRIMDPSTMSAPIPLSLSTASSAPLLRTVNSADYLSIDPSSPGIMSSPPSTPSPTTAYPYQSPHPYSQQHLLLPRKGSLTAMSNYYFQQQTLHSTGSFDDLTSQLSPPPAVPARRKASSPAIFNTTPTATAGVYPGSNTITHSPRYQHLAPTPPPEMMIPPPRSRSTSPFVTTTNNNNNRSNKFSTSPPSPQPMHGFTAAVTAAPIPIPGASSRHPHHRPPIYGTGAPPPPVVNTPTTVVATTTWSETDVYGAPSARIVRPRRHESSEQLHSQSQQQQQQQAVSSPTSASSSSGSTDACRMYIPRTQFAPPVHSH
ncbi:hypothetical protein BGZ96_011970 [Linnemannia gamsii]|uniref:Uncharacterized protein n=1 Tax=Linnemannia gamsii TaxID=64522 RepID=A0ABQ7JRP3_9FUNG|nr:hypothetical protein BGZ96_011970 [Linnemannia gamsii]